MSGAAILFCLIAMQRSVSDSESAPNTVTKRHTKRVLVTCRCIAKRYEALCNARLMQLVPDLDNINEQITILNQILIISMHIASLVKRPCYFLKLLF